MLDRDLREPSWHESLRDFDAVLSATAALHWLTEDELPRRYRDLTAVLRPGGVFANRDHVPIEDARLQEAAERALDAHLERELAAGAESYELWYERLAARRRPRPSTPRAGAALRRAERRALAACVLAPGAPPRRRLRVRRHRLALGERRRARRRQLIGFSQSISRNRAKSVSAEQTVRPCSIASAASCASEIRFPRSWYPRISELNTSE